MRGSFKKTSPKYILLIMNIKKETIESVCKSARRCGGCRYKNTIYNSSLRDKQTRLVRLLSRFGYVEKIIGAAEPIHYRNKMQSAFFLRGGNVESGLYQSSDKRIIATESCMLEDKRAQAIVADVRELCPRFKIRPYDLKTGKGYLRHVLVRTASTGEIMVVLVTAEGEFPSGRSFVNELLRRHPEITCIVHNINDTATALFLGEKCETLYGNGYIEDELCGLRFRISPRSFYQVNHAQTEILYTKAHEMAQLKGNERVIDAYCGTGTIGLSMADSCADVLGIEINRDAIADAQQNAKLNGIENARFVCADAGEYMHRLAECGEHIDTVITDPPRAGCSKKFIEALLTLSPNRIVYISCNPETLARDLYSLTKGGYKVEKMQGVDMFPFTEHVESVVSLTRGFDN